MKQEIQEKMKIRRYRLVATSNENEILHFATPIGEKPSFSCDVYINKDKSVEFSFKYITKKCSILTTGRIGSFFDDKHFNKFEADFHFLALVLYKAEEDPQKVVSYE